MADLELCSNSWDHYQLLRIPGILRLLLLDGLVDQVNREFHRKIHFMAGRSLKPHRSADGLIQPSQLLFRSVVDSFDPEILALDKTLSEDDRKPRPLTRDQLLAELVLVVNGAYVSIKELIDNLAYVHGLTHPDEPDTQKDAALLGWRRLLQMGGTPAGLREIRSVARVVHRGLQPLRDDVLAKYSNADA